MLFWSDPGVLAVVEKQQILLRRNEGAMNAISTTSSSSRQGTRETTEEKTTARCLNTANRSSSRRTAPTIVLAQKLTRTLFVYRRRAEHTNLAVVSVHAPTIGPTSHTAGLPEEERPCKFQLLMSTGPSPPGAGGPALLPLDVPVTALIFSACGVLRACSAGRCSRSAVDVWIYSGGRLNLWPASMEESSPGRWRTP